MKLFNFFKSRENDKVSITGDKFMQNEPQPLSTSTEEMTANKYINAGKGKRHLVSNLIILDESSSMSSIQHTIISGFNELVQSIKVAAQVYSEQVHLTSNFFTMKNNFYAIGLCVSLFFVTSCGNNLSKVSTDAEGFVTIQKELVSKFGDKAYYNNINIVNTPGNRPGSGLTIIVNVTNNPESLKMEEWTYNSYSGWQNTSEITVELPEGMDFKEYLFQFGGKFNLKKAGELITFSSKKLAEEKNLKNAVLSSVLYTSGKNVADEIKIHIDMKPENGGTTFHFNYDLEGNLLDFNY